MLLFAALSEAKSVTLELKAPGAKHVALYGSFNQWQPDVMERQAGGVWQLRLDLPPGRYEFIYKADSQWLADAIRPSISDGMGGRNSLIVITK